MTRDSLVVPPPIEARDLFRPEREALIDLLTALPSPAWSRPTACAEWDVHAVALHVLGGDLNKIARGRDGFTYRSGVGASTGASLQVLNDSWVRAARSISPRLTVELLRAAGASLFEYFDGLDIVAMGEPVSWAGLAPAPVWLDLAREYMERWVHRQHIRDAVGSPGQREARFVAPVVAASIFALPVALARHGGPDGAAVRVRVEGEAGGTWSAVRQESGWRLYEGLADGARATVVVTADDWWRLVTLGLSADAVWTRARVEGDRTLARAVLGTIAMIA